MTRVSYGYFSAGLVDVLVSSIILSFPYVALYLNADRMGTISNIIVALTYTVVCLILSRTRIFKEHRYNLVLGLFIYSVACMLMVCFKNRFTLICVPVLLASGAALFFPTLQVWFTEGMEKPQLIKTIGGYSIAWVTGFLIGPSAGGYIISSDLFGALDLGGRLNILFSAAGIIAFILAVSFIPNLCKQKLQHLSKDEIPPIFIEEVPQEKCRLFLHMMWVAIFGAMFMSGLVRFIFTEMGKEENLNSFVIGNVASVMYLSLILLIIFLRRNTFWLFSFRYLLFFQLLALPAVFFFIFTKNMTLYFTGAVIFGFLLGFACFSSCFYSLMFEGKKDRYIRINETMVGTGSFLSGLLGYIFAGLISVKYSFLPGIFVLSAVIAVETVLYASYKKRHSLKL